MHTTAWLAASLLVASAGGAAAFHESLGLGLETPALEEMSESEHEREAGAVAVVAPQVIQHRVVVPDNGHAEVQVRDVEEPTRLTVQVRNLHTGDVIRQETVIVEDQTNLAIATEGEGNVVTTTLAGGDAKVAVAAHEAGVKQDAILLEDVKDVSIAQGEGAAAEQTRIKDSPTLIAGEGDVENVQVRKARVDGFNEPDESTTQEIAVVESERVGVDALQADEEDTLIGAQESRQVAVEEPTNLVEVHESPEVRQKTEPDTPSQGADALETTDAEMI